MSLLPAKYTLSAWQGGTFRTTITVLSGGAGSAVQDLTGYTGTMSVRSAPNATPLYSLSTTNGQITLGGSAGTVALYIPATDTQSFTWKSGLYVLEVVANAGTGDTEPLMWGTFRVLGIG